MMNLHGVRIDVQILSIGVSKMLIRTFFLLLLMGSSVSYAGFFGDDKAREQINVLQNQVKEMEERIAKMEEALKSQALLELYSQVETMGMELGRMRGQLELLSNDSTILQKRQRDFYIDLDTRLRKIEQPGVAILPVLPEESKQLAIPAESTAIKPKVSTPETTTQPQTVIPASAASPITELVPADAIESSAYDAAYESFLNGDYAGAITQFGSFLHSHPQSSLAPGAAYWVGNAHYAMRNFQNAIDTQNQLIATYPDSPKVPDALLNIASSQQEMNDKKAAKQTLEDLITRYPFSDAADKAKQRLASL